MSGNCWHIHSQILPPRFVFANFASWTPMTYPILWCHSITFTFQNGSTLEIISANFRRKMNLSHVFSAISPSRWPKTSKRMERCPTVATSAATQTSGLLGWNNTCWFTVDCHQSLFDSYLKNFTAKLDWLVHSGEKPFVCIQCNYSFTQVWNLKIYLRTHLGEKVKALQLHKL